MGWKNEIQFMVGFLIFCAFCAGVWYTLQQPGGASALIWVILALIAIPTLIIAALVFATLRDNAATHNLQSLHTMKQMLELEYADRAKERYAQSQDRVNERSQIYADRQNERAMWERRMAQLENLALMGYQVVGYLRSQEPLIARVNRFGEMTTPALPASDYKIKPDEWQAAEYYLIPE